MFSKMVPLKRTGSWKHVSVQSCCIVTSHTYLLNQTNVRAQPSQIEAADIVAIELDRAGCGVVPSFDQANDGTFA